MTDSSNPQLHVDSDWKAQAQAEKERLAQKESQREKEGPRHGPDDLPPADFKGLVGMLAYQAMSGLGIMADQRTGRVVVDLIGSRYYIDMLQVLEDKCKGNLNADESKELSQVLSELRSRFVQIAQLIAQQAPDARAAAGAEPKPADQLGSKPKIILEP